MHLFIEIYIESGGIIRHCRNVLSLLKSLAATQLLIDFFYIYESMNNNISVKFSIFIPRQVRFTDRKAQFNKDNISTIIVLSIPRLGRGFVNVNEIKQTKKRRKTQQEKKSGTEGIRKATIQMISLRC